MAIVSVYYACGTSCTLYFIVLILFVAFICPALLMLAQPLKR